MKFEIPALTILTYATNAIAQNLNLHDRINKSEQNNEGFAIDTSDYAGLTKEDLAKKAQELMDKQIKDAMEKNAGH